MPQDGDVLATVLDTLKRDPSIEFGDPAARIEHLARVDRPFSTVHRLRIHTPTRSVTAYAKILKPYGNTPEELAMADRMLRREFKATKGLFEVLRQDSEIGAVRPIAFLPEHLAVVTEEIPGRPFSRAPRLGTQRDGRVCCAVARRVGGWIRIYQSLGASGNSVSLAERRAYLDERLKQVEGRVISPGERQGVLSTLRCAGRAPRPGSAGRPYPRRPHADEHHRRRQRPDRGAGLHDGEDGHGTATTSAISTSISR